MHHSYFYSKSKSNVIDMIEWAKHSFGEEGVRWWYQAGFMVIDPNNTLKQHPNVAFTFEHEEDAVAFELRWR